MPIPALNSNGLLPVGIHVATIEEIRQRFGSFDGSDRRIQLFTRLEQLVIDLRKSGRFERGKRMRVPSVAGDVR